MLKLLYLLELKRQHLNLVLLASLRRVTITPHQSHRLSNLLGRADVLANALLFCLEHLAQWLGPVKLLSLLICHHWRNRLCGCRPAFIFLSINI